MRTKWDVCFGFFCFFFLKIRGSSLFSLLWLNVAYEPSSETLYYLMINMYDIQEQYLTLLLCKVYLLCLF